MKKKLPIIIFLGLMTLVKTVQAEPMLATDYIKKIATDAGGSPDSTAVIGSTSLAYDDTDEHNLRYVSSSPNNYILFNNERWRIVGVFDNIVDSNNQTISTLKIIRSTPFNDRHSWDTSEYEENSGVGSNIWSGATLRDTLNNDYYNSKSNGNCYFGRYYRTINCNFSSTGIKEASKEYIAKVKWSMPFANSSISLSEHYQAEKNASKITDNIGLLYLSDIGYASLNPQCKNYLYGCVSWLTNSDLYLSIAAYSGNNYSIFKYSSSSTTYDYASTGGYVSPVLYLDKNVSIIDGDGTYSNPYQIAIIKKYNITYENDTSQGTVVDDNTDEIEENSQKSFQINPEKGYVLSEVKIVDEDNQDVDFDLNDNQVDFVMPGSNVTITITYAKIKSSIMVEEVEETKEYNINIENLDQVEYDEEIKISFTPIDGYKLTNITIVDKNNNEIEYTKNEANEYVFKMPEVDITITPEYKKEETSSLDNPNTKNALSIVIVSILLISLLSLLLARNKLVYYK